MAIREHQHTSKRWQSVYVRSCTSLRILSSSAVLNQPSLYWAICLWTNNGFLSHNSLKYIYDYKLGKPIHNDNLLDWKKDWLITTISYWENQEEPSDFLDILNGDFFQQPNFFFILSITNPSKEKKNPFKSPTFCTWRTCLALQGE